MTHAYAICARNRGAEVYTDTWVTGLQQRPDGTWDVITDRDHTIHAEHVVNAGGLWAREVGRMVGLELPVLAMEHHYLRHRADAGGDRLQRASTAASCRT